MDFFLSKCVDREYFYTHQMCNLILGHAIKFYAILNISFLAEIFNAYSC